MTRSYSELIRIHDFEERFRYLSLRGSVGASTFGFDRYLNQDFYRSRQWKLIRNDVIVRDNGCDLGIPGLEIYDRVYIHHMNPMTPDEIIDGEESILDPEFLICVTHQTHNAIHYGTEKQLRRQPTERRSGDTLLWSRR